MYLHASTAMRNSSALASWTQQEASSSPHAWPCASCLERSQDELRAAQALPANGPGPHWGWDSPSAARTRHHRRGEAPGGAAALASASPCCARSLPVPSLCFFHETKLHFPSKQSPCLCNTWCYLGFQRELHNYTEPTLRSSSLQS